MTEQTFGIIGGGIVGLAVGREIGRRHPGTRVVVFEAEDRVAAHQTGHNSGVVHAGIYYKPGSLKAELCTRGRKRIEDYRAEQQLPFDECGKLVFAVDRDEMTRFDALEQTARQNDVPGLSRVEGSGIREIEPYSAGVAALHSPHTAITDFVAIAAVAEIEAAGGRVLLSTTVTGVDRHLGRIDVVAGAERHTVDRLVVCGGLSPTASVSWSVVLLRHGSCPSAASTCRSRRPAGLRARHDLSGARPPLPVPRRALYLTRQRRPRGRPTPS